ncbi:Polyneuridine-aldehyde esterase [Platanthera zijinensis]|uniref:Polyneuridine-aldehyde esterase n=1 Tax=Platanthera zijinensis TaxID=2320716 RepID=A0AAP0GCJ5_9ASPA
MRIILVHGNCHGAWCWYKVVAMLRSQGYSVTAIDLAACGADPRRLPEDISNFDDYSRPLMELVAAVPDGEKVVLVGHMFGGLSLASAMDAFPDKIAVAVFVAAMMPDVNHAPSYIFDQHFKQSPELYVDIDFNSIIVPGSSEAITVTCLDPEFLASKLYQNCTFEDLTLASIMVRPTSLFLEDLSKRQAFSKEGYGTVDKVYIISGEDASIRADFQRWLIENNPVNEVMEISGADHMAMLSKPRELCECIKSIVDKYVD